MGDQCCSTENKGEGKGCCGTKKLIVMVLIAGLCFAAGMLFAKSNCNMSSKVCPMSSAPVAK